ncbi:barH-like 1 homeobox protein [Rattus rattus]|uniref:barH-like 1 homeobox protein n=1 Tax=Rattus rattus TaxID=10117 RepID=UPI0013F2D2BF|nr:barH-like 1 homeobox protein [Rattus rattus]
MEPQCYDYSKGYHYGPEYDEDDSGPQSEQAEAEAEGGTAWRLARNMNVPGAEVQMWFSHRRAKERAGEKKATPRSTPGAKAQMILPAGEGRNGEESERSSPGQEASATKWGEVEELGERDRTGRDGENLSAVGTSGIRSDWDKEGASSSRQKNESRPEKPVPGSRRGMEDVQPVPVLIPRVQRIQVVQSRVQSVPLKVPVVRPVPIPVLSPEPVLVPRRHLHDRFTDAELQELERIFQRNHYLSAEERKELARVMGVSEAKLQRWFKKRRETLQERTKSVRWCSSWEYSTSLKMAQEPSAPP